MGQRCVKSESGTIPSHSFLACIAAFLLFVSPGLLLAAELININTADATLLDTLPGIGPALAAHIIDYREVNGPFASISEIQNVSGIGPATFADISSLIMVSGGIAEEPEEEEEPEETATSTASETASKGASKERIPVPSIQMSMPEIAYVNQPVAFDVYPTDTQERLVRYAWNFGDGMTSDMKSPVHTYEYPGMYVVFVQSRYLGKELAVRGELTVLPATLSLMRADNGDIQLHNDAKYEIDLGGFTLQGEKSFTIPPHTILLPAATLTARRGLLETGAQGFVSVTDPSGAIVVALSPYESAFPKSETSEAATVQRESVSFEASAPLETEVRPVVDVLPNPEVPMVYRPELPAAVSEADGTPFNEAVPYVSLLGVLVVGVLGVLLRKTQA